MISLNLYPIKDGSNIRVEWSKKRGWYKYGTRRRLFDKSDPIFGEAIDIFQNKYAEDLARIAQDSRWLDVVVFLEFYGPGSLAGRHLDEPHTLTLIDAAPAKKGLISPKDFIKIYKNVETARFLGIQRWTDGFREQVRLGNIDCSFEGVVGKSVDGLMAKAKTQAWKDAILA